MDRWIGPFNVRSAVLCEGVRAEVGNKFMIYGIFAGDIVLSQLPNAMALCVYLELRDAVPGAFKTHLRMRVNANEASGAEGVVGIEGAGPTALPLPTLPIVVEEEGTLYIDIKIDDGDWVPLIDRRLSLAPIHVA